MTDHANIVRERVSHIARGCRAGTSHNPAVYENDINAALDALVAEIRSLNEQVVGAVDLLEGAVAERDEARAWAFARSDVEEYIKRAEAAVAERDEAKAQFWQQRHEWAAATGRNQEIIDGLLAERDDTERTNGPWKCLAETETKLAAAEAELAAEKLLRHQDDLALVAAEAEAEVQKRLYEASVKDRVRLREALTDFAEHGTRFDCNPTVMVHNTPEWVASQEWWQNRATQMDVAVRNRARAALREDA